MDVSLNTSDKLDGLLADLIRKTSIFVHFYYFLCHICEQSGHLMIINHSEEIGFLIQLNPLTYSAIASNLVVSAKKLHHQLIATKSAVLKLLSFMRKCLICLTCATIVYVFVNNVLKYTCLSTLNEQ